MSGRLSLAGLVVAVAVIAAWVEVRTPAALLPPPHRPDEVHGRPDVRLAAAEYPRTATGTDGISVTLAGPPRRIISQFWSADEFLYAIVPPERIVGVSETAFATQASNLLDFVERYHPILATNVEDVLRANPDLVLVPESELNDRPALLREAGVPVYRIYTRFDTLQSIEDHMRLIGYLSGEDARAGEAIRLFRDTIQRAVRRRSREGTPPRILGISGSYTNGSHTLFDDVVRTLGAENVAASHGFTGYGALSDEYIVRWNPDWIIAGADRGDGQRLRAALLSRPSIAATSAALHGRVVVIENNIFLSMSPYVARLVDVLSRTLYGDGQS